MEMLAERSRGGDRTAFELLVRQTARGIYAHVLLKTGDAHLADDLTQETYLLAWKRIAALRDPKAFVGWLRSIANAAIIDAARRSKRAKRDAESLREGEAPADPRVTRGATPGSAGAAPSPEVRSPSGEKASTRVAVPAIKESGR